MKKLWLTPEIKGLNFSKDEVETAISKDTPLLLTLYTKGICNAKCPSCFITTEDSSYEELSEMDLMDIINQASTMGIQTIKISGAGEPLIIPEITNILRSCYEKRITPVVYTNGSTLGNDVLCNQIYGCSSLDFIQKLQRYNCSIVYKCNSMTPKLQDYLLGVENMSTMTYKGLLNLIYCNYNSNCQMALQTIITPYNLSEIEELYRFSRRMNIIPYFETVLKKGDAEKNQQLYLRNVEIKDIFLRLSEIDKQEFGIEWFPVPSYVNFQCTELGYALLVDNFGYARYCPGIWEKIGNVQDNSLLSIWKSPAAIAFRERIKQPMGGKCSSCTHKKEGNCGYGCRAYSYLNNGDMFGEYDECWW